VPFEPRAVDGPAGLAAANVLIGAYIPAALAAAAWFGGRRPGFLSSVVGRLRWRWLGWCLGLASACALLHLLILAVRAAMAGDEPFRGWPGWPALVLPTLAVLATTPLQAAAEEYGFRGTVVQMLSVLLPWRWPVAVLSAVSFGLSHLRGSMIVPDAMLLGCSWWRRWSAAAA
jgi:membrane protease YdiL (CAAX protease family)